MFKGKKLPLALIMVQPEAVPGAYRNTGATIQEVVDQTLRETEMIAENGFDGFILQNRNDAPVRQTANPETIAYHTVIGYELTRRFPELVCGVLINWDGIASLAVADAIGADFVRVEHVFTGGNMMYSGFFQAQCVEICEFRKRLGTKVPVFADVQEVHATPIAAKPIVDDAFDAIYNGFADGLFVAGKSAEESIQINQALRKKLGNEIPIFLGGGSTGDNVAELLKYYDGVSVGAWVKDGNMKNPVNPLKAKIFMDGVRKSRG